MADQRVDFLNKKTGDWSVYHYFDGSSILDPKAGGDFPGFAGTTKGSYDASTSSQFGRVNSARRGRVGQFGIKIVF
jgi:hypothetical protein